MADKPKKYSEDIERLLMSVADDCKKEDRATRERQIRTWRRLKLFWESYQRVWYSETAHDWRIWDVQTNDESTDQSYYDKPINVFRAYLESIIAALSVLVPPVTAYPDDADNELDLQTAKAADRIASLIYKHNDISLVWLHALFIWATEGMVAAYSYPKESKDYGEYKEDEWGEELQEQEVSVCPLCGAQQPDDSGKAEQLRNDERDEFQPDEDDVELHAALNEGKEVCVACMQQMDPEIQKIPLVITKLVGTTTKPKSRVCIEAYGGLNVKIPVYARRQEECGYLIYSYEKDYALAIDPYDHLKGNKELVKKIRDGKTAGAYDQYDQWGRLSPQYQGEYPINVVTIDNYWIRPEKFNVLQDELEIKKLKEKFPDGVKVVCIADEFACAEPEALDDCWTISHNPLADYLHYDPAGLLVTSVQEIVNDLISLISQTIEHGIGSAFADPAVLNFTGYSQTETVPGGIYPATPKSGKSLSDGFYELKTATLSGEVMPFLQNIQSLGQIVTGALPSLWGGEIQGSETASQYSMSRAQAKQRIQNTWKVQTSWWKNVFGKAVPMYMKLIKQQGDEKDVQRDKYGNFINVFIRRAELEGKIGKIELEANENLPISWDQQKDTIMNLFNSTNPEVLGIIAAPENLPLIHEALGLEHFHVPGEDDVIKQYDEIRLLTQSEPIQVPPSPEMQQEAMNQGIQPPQPQDIPSVEPEIDIDNHKIHFEICCKWLISDTGRITKIDNPNGYKNVLLHAKMHKDEMQAQMMQQSAIENPPQLPPDGAGPPAAKANPLTTKEAPIQGEGNVQTVQ